MKDMDLIEGFKNDEERMNMEIAFRTSSETFIIPEERIYKVNSSGASVSSGYSISLLHQYCSKLPHDEYGFILIDLFFNLKYLLVHLLYMKIQFTSCSD